ncbi:hypothetical protein K3495_g15672 [Podosphaera aphanis]|nr:hypothetical protein K3495_g15672 [Podosphaera aphanis]
MRIKVPFYSDSSSLSNSTSSSNTEFFNTLESPDINSLPGYREQYEFEHSSATPSANSEMNPGEGESSSSDAGRISRLAAAIENAPPETKAIISELLKGKKELRPNSTNKPG